MKKQIMISALAGMVAIGAATAAYSGWGQRGGGYWNNDMQDQGPRMQRQYNQAPGPRMQMQYNQLDPAAQEKLDQFFTDTQDIRKEIAVKRAERMALIRSENPDPAAAGKLAGELFDLRTTMHQKAEEAGVTAYLGPMNGPRGGRDFGPGNRGMGRGQGKGGGYMNNMQGGPGPRGSWY
ncbi:MAG: periplasmic heavy metal sensor [Desulfofustis sp.]|nr:periplasmic heavy metal sensor [Desulfofustis sp.]